MRVVLASSSPRRAVLLRHLLDGFTVHSVPVDEVAPHALSVAEAVQVIARKKALAVSLKEPDAYVLAADTVVVYDGMLMDKAVDEAEERERLATLSGTTHQVTTGLALAWDGRAVDAASAVTAVHMDRLPRDVVDAYVASGAWRGKAGGYGIQDAMLAPFVRLMAGPWSNVVGLPVGLTRDLLERNRVVCKQPPAEEWLRLHAFAR